MCVCVHVHVHVGTRAFVDDVEGAVRADLLGREDACVDLEGERYQQLLLDALQEAHLRMCVHVCMHAHVCVCACACVCARVHVYACVCMCMHVYACAYRSQQRVSDTPDDLTV